jgi:hypothetical protein
MAILGRPFFVVESLDRYWNELAVTTVASVVIVLGLGLFLV